MELLATGLAPFVDQHMAGHLAGQKVGEDWIVTAASRMGKHEPALVSLTDPQFQLEVLTRWWGPVFSHHLRPSTRDVVAELRQARNDWAHITDGRPIDYQYALRVYDLVEELLREVGSEVAEEVALRAYEMRRRHAQDVAEEEGVDTAEVYARELAELEKEREHLRQQLEQLRQQLIEARRRVEHEAGKTKAVARQLAALQNQYAAVAQLKAAYEQLQEDLVRIRQIAGGDPDSLESETRDAQNALEELRNESIRLARELAEARRALEDPLRTPAGRRWVMLTAALVLVLGLALFLAAVGVA